ncbi:MAG: FecR domain-containing protein [Elusimicrobia bacterium]|nr:FecR domain-containing protein [Elusimicrobiota bacterium]
MIKKPLIFIFLLTYSLLTTHSIVHAARIAAVSTSVNGKVEILPYKKKVWDTLKIGTYIHEGDTVKTGRRSRAAFTLTNGVELKLRSNTEFGFNITKTIEKIGSTVRMVSGRIWSKVRTRTKFEIHTPVAIVAVRGTEFGVGYGNGMVDLSVVKGIVNLKNKHGEVNVGEGKKSSAGAGAPPAPPTDMDKSDKKEWEDEMKETGSIKIGTKVAKPVVSVPFKIDVSVYGADGKLDSGSNDKITVGSESGSLMFSDDGKSWDDKIKIKVSAGTAELFVKSDKAGTEKIIASSDKLDAGILEVSSVEPKEKNLKMKVKTEDGTEEILLQFKKQ